MLLPTGMGWALETVSQFKPDALQANVYVSSSVLDGVLACNAQLKFYSPKSPDADAKGCVDLCKALNAAAPTTNP